MIIGLTGQTGSGKSTVSAELQKRGFYICDCDKVARDVREDAAVIKMLKFAFGSDIEIGGRINNKLLAQRAFKDENATALLNSIMHPIILDRAFSMIEKAISEGYEYAVLDGAVLFESGADKRCDFMVSVVAPKEERLKRLIKRDGITEKEALLRMSVQKGEDFYTERSDFVIRNEDITLLNAQINGLLQIIIN